MTNSAITLTFLWWNLENFAHFDTRRVDNARWPKSTMEFNEKLRRVEAVVKSLPTKQEFPALLAFAEITEQAANSLRDHLCPTYTVYSLARLYDKPDFNIALLYDPKIGLGEEELLTFANVPDATRPMAILDCRRGKNLIRFYAGHWTARFSESSEQSRQLSALGLRNAIFQFLHPEEIVQEVRHVVVMGDFNEEPYGLMEKWLYAYRDRARSQYPVHYTDKSIRRVYLYNCAWRLLGERSFHPQTTDQRAMAGTYYWRDKKSWHTFDQILVSGSLLTNHTPYLDESSIQVLSDSDSLPDNFLADDGLPQSFCWNEGNSIGISDHLPLFGTIIL